MKLNKFFGLFRNLGRQQKITYLALFILSAGISSYLLWLNSQQKLYLAVGSKDGESYHIGKAIEKASGGKIIACTTKGTEENLKLLKAGKVQLVTAQADVASETTGMEKEPSSQQPTSSGESDRDSCAVKSLSPKFQGTPKTVAILYRDVFQLFVKDNNPISFDKLSMNEIVHKLKEYKIGLKQGGGQFESFQKIINNYGLSKEEFNFLEDTQHINSNIYGCQENEKYAVFFVRALKNEGISKLVKQCRLQLLPIKESEAMKIEHPSFQKETIPSGTYRDINNKSIPQESIETIGVERLLLASNNVPNQRIEELTKLLYDSRSTLKAAIEATSEEEIPNTVKPRITALVTSITSPPNNIGSKEIPIPIHDGARAYYEPDKNVWSRLNANADGISLLLTVFVYGFPAAYAIYIWVQRRRINTARNKADKYLEETILLMDKTQDVEERQKQLDKVFNEAAEALVKRQISQESFRTFNEAYKTTREAIERDKQNQIYLQQEEADKYIKAAIDLMDSNKIDDIETRQEKLDKIFNEAAKSLIDNRITQETFRTFNETYKTTREKIDRERHQEEEKLKKIKQLTTLNQQEISAQYIEKAVSLLQDKQMSPEVLNSKLNEILEQVSADLVAKRISQESFRTFVEAYKVIRDAIL
jgi:uncharacterized protein